MILAIFDVYAGRERDGELIVVARDGDCCWCMPLTEGVSDSASPARLSSLKREALILRKRACDSMSCHLFQMIIFGLHRIR